MKFIAISYNDQVTDDGFPGLFVKLSLYFGYHNDGGLDVHNCDFRQFKILLYLGQYCPLFTSICFDDVSYPLYRRKLMYLKKVVRC